nr:reverse transcriptase domain-containing protein [Tanacetum cinerariifolium]
MAGPEPITPLNEGTSNQNFKSIIEGHVPSLKELLKEPSNRDLIKPMLLDFDDVQDVSDEEIEDGAKEKAKIGGEDLSKPFKEELKSPFTRRIVEFSSPAREWFDKLPPDNINNWRSLQEKFLNRFGMLKAFDKDPTEISKIVRRANETLPHFKERWVSESNVIPNIPDLMQIASFMSSHKYPKLAQRFSDNVPKTADEMLKRVDDYLRSEEAFCNTELPMGEFQWKDVPTQWVQRGDRQQRYPYGNGRRRQEHISAFKAPERSIPYVPPQRPNQEKLELDLESGKLNHLVKDGRQRGRGAQGRFIHHPWHDEIPNPLGVATLVSQTSVVFECRREGKKQAVEPFKERGTQATISLTNQVLINPAYLEQLVTIGAGLSPEGANQLRNLLKKNIDIFAWELSDMPGQNRSCHGFPTHLFLRRVQRLPSGTNGRGRWGKKAIDHGTNCYTKIPFGLKNARATYQRLIDGAFRSQFGRNLEAYVDDMVIKSKLEGEMLADIVETFDSLRRINMKLNLKMFVLSRGREVPRLHGHLRGYTS